MKKYIALLLSILITIGLLPTYSVLAANLPQNIAAGRLSWGLSGWGTTPHNAFDGNIANGWDASNRNPGNVQKVWAQLAPEGEIVPAYNKAVVRVRQYNSQNMGLYSSNSVNNPANLPATSGPIASPPDLVSAKELFVQNFDEPYPNYGASNVPDGALTMTPYYNFEPTNDRYVRFQNTVAYTSGGSTGRTSFRLNEVELYYVVPKQIDIATVSEGVYIPYEGSEEIMLSATVKDEFGDNFKGTSYSNVTWSLDGEYEGVSINSLTGKLTVRSTAEIGEVAIHCASAVEGFNSVTGQTTVNLLPTPPEYVEVAQALSLLTFDKISKQDASAVTKDLDLIEADGDTLTIGGTEFEDMDIAWSSSDASVIDNDGTVTRGDITKTVTITAKVSKGTVERTKTFEVTVVKAGVLITMPNLVKGSYGWVTSGWGTASNAVDGDPNNPWRLGGHTVASQTAGFITKSREAEKYNKIIISLATHLQEAKMVSCTVTGYETNTSDPGVSGNKAVSFTAGSGAVPILSYNVLPDDPNTVTLVVNLPQSAESKYFGITLANGTPVSQNQNDCGVYEFEVYYATPYDVKLADEDTVLYVPSRAGTASFDIPELTVFDEAGDVIVTPFEHDLSLARNYNGITLKDGKINISYGCTADSIDLVYRTWDEDREWLNKTITIPLKPYTQEYYDAVEAGEYFDGFMPEKLEADILLPVEYNGAAITWASDNEGYLSAAGVVNRPAYTTKDENTVLTATITKGKYTITKAFNITVIRAMTDQQRVILDGDHIDLGISDTVSGNITLPGDGYYGSSIAWTSSRPDIISGNGTYHRIEASKSRMPVTLSARLTYNGVEVKKDFAVYASADVEDTGSGGGGGGKGGTSSSKSYPSSGGMAAYIPPMTALTDDEIIRGVFEDVPAAHWAREYVEKLAARRIVSGIDEGHFEPDRTITREEFIKMIVTAFGFTIKPGETKFADIQNGAWYEDYVVTAYKEGIINGVSDTQFGIGQKVTREDMAAIMERVLARQNVNFMGSSKSFSDAGAIAEYAVSAVNKLTMIGVLSGDEAGNFAPKKNATRAETAKVLLTAMEKGGI